MESINIRPAESVEEIELVKTLLEEYARSLGFSLCFQGFAEELANLPGKYAPPTGRLVLARIDSAAAGCGALRPVGSLICEMKRLYVRPAFRGLGLGRKLAEHLVAEATKIGYSHMRLDTVSSKMVEAGRLYRALGFYEIPAYYHNPQPDVCYLERRLR
jgi:ribosomal protein S18 acetylase RimI-like enzyme